MYKSVPPCIHESQKGWDYPTGQNEMDLKLLGCGCLPVMGVGTKRGGRLHVFGRHASGHSPIELSAMLCYFTGIEMTNTTMSLVLGPENARRPVRRGV